MLRSFQRCGWLLLLAAVLPSVQAFSLFGPVGNGGDSYQTSDIGYGTLPTCVGSGFIGAPKNMGEEYRWNIPTLYYACDQNFLDYFGSNGVAAVDQAMLILSNHLSAWALTSWSSGLNEFPLYTTRDNYSVGALYLTDIKSTTLRLMLEELGLADSRRWTFTLRLRELSAGAAACPFYDYTVIQRNFDPVTGVYSRFINGAMFTYTVTNGPCATCDNASVDNYPVSSSDTTYSPVAAAGMLRNGAFFTGLTRDDMGGLRYLLSPANLNVESLDPNSTLIGGGFTNRNVTQTLTSQDLAVFSQQALTNNDTALQALYPDLRIVSSSGFLANLVSSNLVTTIIQTNLNVVTNLSQAGISQIITNTATNFAVSTLDLAVFALQSLTNNAAALQALYPDLIVTGENYYFTNAVTTNTTAYLTNYPWSAAGTPFSVVLVTNFTTHFVTNYIHTFANVVTNSVGHSGYVTTVTTSSGTSAWSTPGTYTTKVTTQTVLKTNYLVGDFYILPTNLCGYVILSIPPPIPTVIPATNLVAQVSTNAAFFFQSTVTYFTNHQFVVQPITCFGTVTNYATNIVTEFNHIYGNVITNTSSTNSLVTVIETNLVFCNGLAGSLCPTVTVTNVVTNQLSGSIFILPTNQCGLSIVSNQLVSVVNTTNTMPLVTNTDGSMFSRSIVTYYTNYTVNINPVDCQATGYTDGVALRQGMNRMYFVRHDYDSLVGQYYGLVTNTYQLTAVQGGQPVAQTFRRVVGRPDILFTARDLFSGSGNNNPITRTVDNFNTANVLPGLAGPGTRIGPIAFTFNKVGPVFYNQGSFFMDEISATTNNLVWSSFDGTTNPPVVFPSTVSLAGLEAQVFMQITTAALPLGTNGVAYTGATLAGSGGTRPYTWTVAGFSPSGLPAGLTLSSGGLISGTPASGSTGVYDITIQMTDSGQRSVSRDLILTVQ